MGKSVVMVVDDNQISAKLFHRFLFNDFEVVEAYNGFDCLEKLSSIFRQGKSVDCLILDIMMPRKDGFEVVKEIRDGKHEMIPRDIPIVIITGLNDTKNQITAIESGADYFIAKPIEEVLLVSLAKCLAEISKYREIVRKVPFLEKNDIFPTRAIAGVVKRIIGS
jgi:two-component system cell cycle response regulator